MRIERINDNKIKIFVSFDELEDRDINIDSLVYNSYETKELFLDLMEKAEIEFGFDTSESNLCIEAVSDMDHGFIVTITKLEDNGEFEPIQNIIKNRYKKNELKLKRPNTSVCSTAMAYKIDSYDSLTTLCQEISEYYFGNSTIYKFEDIYYMILTGFDKNTSNYSVVERIISEYADLCTNTVYIEGYLREHGTLMVANNAIQVLSKLK